MVKIELGKELLKLRLGHINETSYKGFLKNISNNEKFPIKTIEQEQSFKDKYFKKIDQEVKLYKEILDKEIILFKHDYDIRSNLRWSDNERIILLLVKYDLKPSDYIYQLFWHLFNYKKDCGIDLMWAINSEIFEEGKKESKARLIFYRNGKVEFDNYEEIVKFGNDELGKFVMPQGFIYTQLDENDHPVKFWPNNKWMDISEQYSGLFFRVIGGQSRAFDRNQEQSYPGLEIESSISSYTKINSKINITIMHGQWSDYLRTGGTYPNKKRIGLSFHVTNDEVRPKNTAIRIWKCLGGIPNKGHILWTRKIIEEQLLMVGK